MKSKFKILGLFMTMVVMLTSLVLTASASRYSMGTFSIGTTGSETSNYYFDANPASKIRFITTPSCSVAGAQVVYSLHTDILHANKPLSQTMGVGRSVRLWWNAAAGKYHVNFSIYNNNISQFELAPVYMNGTNWFENFTGNV